MISLFLCVGGGGGGNEMFLFSILEGSLFCLSLLRLRRFFLLMRVTIR